MKIKINKQEINLILENIQETMSKTLQRTKDKINPINIDTAKMNTNFMVGVNKGFHDSPLPSFAVNNYSNLDTLKKKNQKLDLHIAQDLGLRMGSQLISKATIGGLVYGAGRLAQDEFLDPEEFNLDSNDSKMTAGIPAIAAAWVGSDKLNSKIPSIHKKVFGKNSIYK